VTRPADALARSVARWADERCDGTAFTALSYLGRECRATHLTYRELHRTAGALADRIRSVTAPGDRVAILCEHGLDYVVAFLACLYSARIAVPLFPVAARRNADRLAAVLADAEPALVLVSPGAETRTRDSGVATGRILPVSITDRTAGCILDPAGPQPAYLQYTSGSTRTPAGVEVTHANLAAALDHMRSGLPAARSKPVVTWLPFFHDMGLVLALALPLYTGVPAVTLPPADFAKRPIRWLRACADYRAGTTASPNFGLSLAVSGTTADERAGLDLSALDLLLNGAEPIRAESLTAFTNTFAPYGFRHRAHTPGYGLAEATLPVSYGAQDVDPVTAEFDRAELAAGHAVVATTGRAGVTLVGCGAPARQAVRVVDPVHGAELGDGEMGEIWVAGPNIGAGYFRRPRASAATFGATLPGSTERWLRTGDLGFVHAGQLFIAGRLGDTIVIDGRNHHPADIEATAAGCSPGLRTGHVAAFGIDDGDRETLIVVAELDAGVADPGGVAGRIRAAVAAAHDIAPADVVLVARGQIPKTSSGKLRRGECRTRYRGGGLRRVAGPALDGPHRDRLDPADR
jgi:fatty acid CoA ligase FadD32